MIIFINLNQKMQHTLEATQNEMNQREYDNLKRQHKTIYYFTSLIENRDLENAGHEIRLSKMIELFAGKCALAEIYPDEMTEKFINRLVEAVPFHDVGKIKLPEEILRKPGKYSYSEMEIMQKHTEYGADISRAILSVSYGPEFTNLVYDLCKYHHEKWNGRGYPENLKGSDIPLCARFMAIVDAFDAMVNYRCYKEAISYDEAFDIIKMEAGEQFDPVLAQEFIHNRKKIIEINEEYKDNTIEG
jgi:response regulator RpfG family c-di-GMP phosphodiesterase